MAWYISDIIKQAARDLRKSPTESEKLLWDKLRTKNLWVKFLRQKPIYVYTEDNWLDRYVISDFCSLEIKLIIEVDGNIHEKEEVYILDREKKKLLEKKWFRIIRIQNNEISENIDTVIEKIVASFP